jgi:hypothetical protein
VIVTFGKVVHLAVEFLSFFKKSVNYNLDVMGSQMVFPLLSFAYCNLVGGVLDLVLAKEDIIF